MTRKNNIILLASALIAIAIVTGVVINNYIRKAIYIKAMNVNVDLMYDGFAESSRISDDAFDNWQLVIEEQPSNNYASGAYNESFEDAVSSKGVVTSQAIESLKKNIVGVEGNIAKLTPYAPAEHSRYTTMMNMYKAYKDLANLALRPTSTIAKYRADSIKAYNDYNKAMKQYNIDYRE